MICKPLVHCRQAFRREVWWLRLLALLQVACKPLLLKTHEGVGGNKLQPTSVAFVADPRPSTADTRTNTARFFREQIFRSWGTVHTPVRLVNLYLPRSSPPSVRNRNRSFHWSMHSEGPWCTAGLPSCHRPRQPTSHRRIVSGHSRWLSFPIIFLP